MLVTYVFPAFFGRGDLDAANEMHAGVLTTDFLDFLVNRYAIRL